MAILSSVPFKTPVSNMKFLLTLGVLSIVAAFSNAAPHCHMSELWSCVEIYIEWLHSLPKRSIPETEADVEVFCNTLDRSVNCAFGYRDNCTTPLQKELIGLTVEGALELQKDFCTPGSSSRTKYLAHAVCLNKVSHLDEIKEQIEYILAVFENVQKVPENQVITYACCGYAKTMNAFDKLGTDNCGKEAVDAATELISMAFAQLPEVVCNGFDGEDDKCKAVLPPAGSKPSDAVKGTAIYQFLRDLLKNWLD